MKPYLIFAILFGAIISFCDDQLDQGKTSQEAIDEYNKNARDKFQKLQKKMNTYSQRKCSESLEEKIKCEEKKSNQSKQKNNDYKGWREIFNVDENLTEILDIWNGCIDGLLRETWMAQYSIHNK